MGHTVIYQRRPKHPARYHDLPRVILTDRDKAIIKTLYSYRVLETPQLQQLFFTHTHTNPATSLKTCQRRLRALRKAGYLWQGEQASKYRTEGVKPFIYRVARRGIELLPELLGIEPELITYRPHRYDVSDFFLNHLLRTNDVRIAFALACKRHHWTIQTWLDEKDLKRAHAQEHVWISGERGMKQKVAVIPDGYFDLVYPPTGKHYHHFLEVDLGTLTASTSDWRRRSWTRKISAYIAYFHSGKFRKRYKGAKQLKILTVTTTNQRLAALKTITEQAKGRTRFWFTTLDQITPSTALTKPIWHVATRENTTEALIKTAKTPTAASRPFDA